MTVRLYAVLRLRPRPRPALPRGLHGEHLTIVKHAGCSMAVAEAPAPLDPAVENLLEFDRVIRALAGLSEAILPARFGTLSPSALALKSEIAERAGALTAALDNVAGRVQMTVRIPAEPKGPAPGSGSRPRPSASGKGSAYLQMRAAGSRSPALTRLRKTLADLVRDERIEAPPDGASVSHLIYHLIGRGDVAAYLERLERLKDVRASGPFPPYAFVPGIDHAVWPGYDNEKSEPTSAGSARPRTHRRSPRNAGR